MERCGRLFKGLLLARNNHSLFLLQRAFYTTQQANPFPEFQDLPYTKSMYRKNYLKYNNLSVLRIDHDYVYKPHERLPTLQERLEEYADPNDKRSTMNIGYSLDAINDAKIRGAKEKLKENKKDKELEKLSRTNQLQVPFEQVHKEYRAYHQVEELKRVAEHYNLYKDLYDSGFFYPIVDFNVSYEFKSDSNQSEAKNVYFGNKLEAKHTSQKPVLDLKNLDASKYYTLTFMNLDGNVKDNNSEVLLWFVANINKDKNETGNEILNYIPPFPMKGTGWHRCVYVLYEHSEPVDFSDHFKAAKKQDIVSRSFKNLDFYLKYQKSITPVSFVFFQTQWDPSVRNTFHNILDMKEPVYEYDFGKKFIPAKEKYPVRQVFNWYIEDYKDVKDINEEVIKDYMKQVSPFDDYPEPLKYPGIEQYREDRENPRWFKYEKQDEIFRRQKFSIVPFKYSSAIIQKSQQLLRSLPFGIHNSLRERRKRYLEKRAERDQTQKKTIDTKKQQKKAKKAADAKTLPVEEPPKNTE